MRVRRRLALLGAAVALLAVAAPQVHAAPRTADTWTARPATYGVFVQQDVAITMSDGAVLAADIHFPADPHDLSKPAAGAFPALLVQTVYNKNQQNPADDYLVQRGYVDVVVDVRGTGSSDGGYDSYSAATQQDSYELVEWIARQRWSDGNVGLHGESAYAINQLLTAAKQPPHLRAMFPIVPEGDLYRTNFPGGYLTSLSAFAVLDGGNGLAPPDFLRSDPDRAQRELGAKPGGLAGQVANVAGLELGDGHTYDGPVSWSSSPLTKIEQHLIKTPTFLVGGWYDALSQADVPKMFHALQAQGVPVKMLMGPWYHTTAGAGLPQDGLQTLEELQLRWFDHWVKGVPDRSLGSLGPVLYQRLGEGRYHTAPTWPIPRIAYRHAYLGGASSPGRAGTLTTAPPTSATAGDVLPWQPVSGVCTRSTYVGTFGMAPTTPCETNDALNDATGLAYDLPVPTGLDLTGPMSAHLFVSTSRNDAFVTLHLSDVDPATGASNEITGGWDSLVFREVDPARSMKVGGDYVIPYHPSTQASERSADIQSGRIYDWWVELRPSAVRIPAGHVLRFSIQTSDAVRFLPTLNRASKTVGSTLTVHHDPQHPSMIVLPVGG